MLASSVGSLTNPSKLARTFESKGVRGVSDKTLCSYIDMLLDAFIITRAERYDIKGKRYIASPYKYYFADVGLRNARLNFRQQEENHIMENIIFNELLMRGYSVDVGVALVHPRLVQEDRGRARQGEAVEERGRHTVHQRVGLPAESRQSRNVTALAVSI